MAFSGSQITRLGLSGIPRGLYGQFYPRAYVQIERVAGEGVFESAAGHARVAQAAGRGEVESAADHLKEEVHATPLRIESAAGRAVLECVAGEGQVGQSAGEGRVESECGRSWRGQDPREHPGYGYDGVWMPDTLAYLKVAPILVFSAWRSNGAAKWLNAAQNYRLTVWADQEAGGGVSWQHAVSFQTLANALSVAMVNYGFIAGTGGDGGDGGNTKTGTYGGGGGGGAGFLSGAGDRGGDGGVAVGDPTNNAYWGDDGLDLTGGVAGSDGGAPAAANTGSAGFGGGRGVACTAAHDFIFANYGSVYGGGGGGAGGFDNDGGDGGDIGEEGSVSPDGTYARGLNGYYLYSVPASSTTIEELGTVGGRVAT